MHLNKKTALYRASDHVRLGVPDEHSYNMFLSVMILCTRIGLWEATLQERQLYATWSRMTYLMKIEHTKRKEYAKNFIS